jgi:nicotinate-nucleotide adenylyltransferase
MKIGILGGTFDPPHVGHLSVARAALKQLELDEILFLPASKNPLKMRAVGTSGKHRLGMVEALIRNEEQMAVSDMELTRGGVSYTVDTLGELHMVQPAEYWFLMGADSLRGLAEWKNPQRLLRLARLAVAVRPPLGEAEVIARIPTEFRERVDMVQMSPIDISSTDLRDRIKRNQNVSAWIPQDVLKYIATYQLYKD